MLENRVSVPEMMISIHALRGEGDAFSLLEFVPLYDISIHALRGEGDTNSKLTRRYIFISIHALRGEGD